MDYETLRRLKKNPHFKLSKRQEEELAQYETKHNVQTPRRKTNKPKKQVNDIVRHSTSVPKDASVVDKHDTELPKEDLWT